MLYGCAYSPDELTIAAGGCGNGVNQAKLFDNKTGQPTERVTAQHGVYCLAFAPSGKKLAIGGVDQAMSIINSGVGKSRCFFCHHHNNIQLRAVKIKSISTCEAFFLSCH